MCVRRDYCVWIYLVDCINNEKWTVLRNKAFLYQEEIGNIWNSLHCKGDDIDDQYTANHYANLNISEIADEFIEGISYFQYDSNILYI